MNHQFLNITRRACAFALPAVMLALASPAWAQNGGRGYGPGPGLTTPVQPATDAEKKWLTFMREEEKLARDVYQALNKKWNLVIFQNISQSEERHYQSVGTLLERYGVADPAADKAAGVYSDPRLSALYLELMAAGEKSVQDALAVGVAIEKADIADLEQALEAAEKLDIKRVFANLMTASYDHLESFETGCQVAAPPAN